MCIPAAEPQMPFVQVNPGTQSAERTHAPPSPMDPSKLGDVVGAEAFVPGVGAGTAPGPAAWPGPAAGVDDAIIQAKQRVIHHKKLRLPSHINV